MSQIGDRRADLDVREYSRDGAQADANVSELIKAIKKDRARAVDLTRLEVKDLSPADQQKLAQMLAQQLKGQIPAQIGKQLLGGDADPGLLQNLAQRLANSVSGDAQSRLPTAPNPDAARNAAAEPGLPQQALRWAEFVQKPTHVPGGGVQSRAGSAAPKGEGTRLAEMIANKLAGNEGPSLRLPRLIEKTLSPAQRQALLTATFGKELAEKLERLGIGDPLTLVKAGALPSDRQKLAEGLDISRGALLGLLMRAELLKIGPGRNGEIGIRPDLLAALNGTGISMLGTLAAMRGLSAEEMAFLYRKLRKQAGGFAKSMGGGRIPVKRDLQHWARSAAHKRSEILLADSEEWLRRERGGGFSHSDAEELVHAWYLENLFWQELANARRRVDERDERRRREQDEERRRRGEDDGQQGSEDEGEDAPLADDLSPDLEHDQERDDRLICFWITDYAHPDPTQPGGMRHLYVCVDPESGAIIPQAIEREVLPQP